MVCDIFHKKAEIWDSLPDGRHNKKRENDCHISVSGEAFVQCNYTYLFCSMLLMSTMFLCMQQLLYLDSVFHDDILSVFGTGWTFSSFSVVSPLDANPIQPNGVDCGIFVIRHMQYYRQLWYDRVCIAHVLIFWYKCLIRNEMLKFCCCCCWLQYHSNVQ